MCIIRPRARIQNRSRDLRQPLPSRAVPTPANRAAEEPTGGPAGSTTASIHPSFPAAAARRPRMHPSPDAPGDPSGDRSEGKKGEKEAALGSVPFWCPSLEAPGARLPANGRRPAPNGTRERRRRLRARPRPRLPRARPAHASRARPPPFMGSARGGESSPRGAGLGWHRTPKHGANPRRAHPSVTGICVRGGRAVMERAGAAVGRWPRSPRRRDRKGIRHTSG